MLLFQSPSNRAFVSRVVSSLLALGGTNPCSYQFWGTKLKPKDETTHNACIFKLTTELSRIKSLCHPLTSAVATHSNSAAQVDFCERVSRSSILDHSVLHLTRQIRSFDNVSRGSVFGAANREEPMTRFHCCWSRFSCC